jgi:hypothetical protein
MRVEYDLDAKPFIPDRRVAKPCPICQGRGDILCAPDIAQLTEKAVAHAHPVS